MRPSVAATSLAVLLLATPAVGPGVRALAEAAPPMAQSDIEEMLTCQCGCGLTVHTCNHLQCGFAVPVKNDIAESLAAGQTADEIIARYVAEYGEKILSSPTHEGFNLVAWYGPYVAIAIGAIAIVFVIRRWTRRSGRVGADGEPDEEAATSSSTADKLSDDDRRKLDQELEGLGR
jgi:cytochrome c-type biogenesis protein CcmH